MVSIITRVKLFAVCIAFAGIAYAYEGEIANIYQIEVIVFEHTDPKRFDAEKWPKAVGKLDVKGAVKLSSVRHGAPESIDVLDALDDVGDEPLKTAVPTTISIVENKSLRLQEESRILKNSKTARVIQHFGWTQGLANYVRSTPILVQTGKNNEEIQALIDIKPIARNQFNVNFDMIFTTDARNKQAIKELRITREIKLKSKEIFYFDHPIISAMIVITPLVVDN